MDGSTTSPPSTIHPEVPIQPISSVRRKPRMTYKSPSGDASFIIGPFSFTAEQKSASSSPTPHPITLKVTTGPMHLTCTSTPIKRRSFSMVPPLPLYHPLGRLASSLPPLDPASVGLPTPVRSDDSIRSSSRARRPAVKLRDVMADDETALTPTAVTTSAVLDVEIREKASPRKRRRGGGSKRKRREVDDGDATYPAKRTRVPRGTSNQLLADDEAPLESNIPEVILTPEPMSEVPEDRQPERRSTRSRGSVKRRDSSASEAASSNSTGVAVAFQDREESIPMEVGKDPDPVVQQHQGDVKVDEKEEGELSDDGLPPNAS
ncbi:hypothetical protein C0991_011031 [Blastosporella zonata]|nr:hypothetical protein C0991_011031 [Blastosporella zonata]